MAASKKEMTADEESLNRRHVVIYGRGDGPKRPTADRPLRRMTTTLLATYKKINRQYYENKAREREKEGKAPWADENHDYILVPGEDILDRYVVRGRIGKGSFGQVVKCHDKKTRNDVAMKIIKNKKAFKVQAQTEIRILELIQENDKRDKHHLVRLLDSFEHRGHPCIIFEQLSYNLFDLLRNTKFRGVSLDLLHKFARQLLEALLFLSSELNVIHCDLKPENILLCQPKRSAIKLIDFGSSCKSDKKMYSYIQSRFYRSPEVLLGVPYTSAIDIWSLGCILVEMHTGEPLFGGIDSHDQLFRITQTLGPLPDELVHRGSKKEKYFTSQPVTESAVPIRASAKQLDSPTIIHPSKPSTTVADGTDTTQRDSSGTGTTSQNGQSRDLTVRYELKVPERYGLIQIEGGATPMSASPASNKNGNRKATGATMPPRQKLADVIGIATGGPGGRRLGERGHDIAHYAAFNDIVSSMLRLTPSERVKPEDALTHRFLQSKMWSNSDSGSSVSSMNAKNDDKASAKNGTASSPQDSSRRRSPRRIRRPPSRGMYAAAAAATVSAEAQTSNSGPSSAAATKRN